MGRIKQMYTITNPENTAKINPNNLRLKDDFLGYLRSIQRAPGTISGYDNDLLIIFTYIMESLDNKNFQDLTKRDIIALQNWMVERGNSPARIRRVKSAISSLSNYCENILADDDPDFEGYRSIVRKIENPTLQPVWEKTVWQIEELEDLMNKLIEMNKPEVACFIALGTFSGRRKAELLRFKVSDFDDSRLVCDGALYKSAPIQTKGNKYLECYTLAKRFKPYLDLWMADREARGIKSEWLFPKRTDYSQHREITAINRWAEHLTEISGRDFYMHSLRHAFTSYLLRSGIPDNIVTEIIGWQSADMVRIYNDNPKDEEIAKYFKNGDICAPEQKAFGEL